MESHNPPSCVYNVVGLFYGTKAPGARADAEIYSMLDRNKMECAKASSPVKSRPVRQASRQTQGIAFDAKQQTQSSL
jgi:hypothetical protein